MIILEDRTLKNKRPDIYAQVNFELTAINCPKIDTETITYGSKKKMWWTCDLDNRHVWQTSPNERTTGKGKGCLVCAGYVIIAGVNDLATRNPKLALQWHPTKNLDLGDSPTTVSATSKKKVWWECEKFSNHAWKTDVKSRHYGSGCPICDNKLILEGFNDFATVNPHLVSEWNTQRNGDKTPYNVPPSGGLKVWWNCPKDDRHIYPMSLNDRHNKHGCTVCPGRYVIAGVNDAASNYPELAKEWHPIKNGELKFSEFSVMSMKPAWWVCKIDPRHEWKANISSRTSAGNGCSVCSGHSVIAGINDLLSINPKLAAEWHPTLNGDNRPDQITPSSTRKRWWQCTKDASHSWESTPGNRTDSKAVLGTGCPKCLIPKTENAFRVLISEMSGLEFIDSQIPVKWSKRKTTQIDMFNAEHKICVEYDGEWSHGGRFHSPRSLAVSLDRDNRKSQALLDAGYRLIRIRENSLIHLPMAHANLFQISWKYGTGKESVIETCLSFIETTNSNAKGNKNGISV